MAGTGTYSQTRARLRGRFLERQAQDGEPVEELPHPTVNNDGGDGDDGGDDGNGGNGDEGMGNGQPNDGHEEEPGALTPGLDMKGVFRFSTNKTHYHIWKSATSKLEEELFDCTADQFFQFMKSLEERANQYGWAERDNGILWVRPTEGAQPINVLRNYGSISLEAITRHELTYWNTGNRASQDDRMLYECIMSSLSLTGKSKVNIHSKHYHIGNPRRPSGLCLLKVVVRESYLDSNATTVMIREQLSALDLHMPTINNNITRFNNHVTMLVDALNARGERTLDLLTYLFRAYNVCNDQEFVKFIRDLQTEHEMGTRHIDAKVLMSQAETKYKILVTTKRWQTPTATEEKLIAMQARLTSLQQKLDVKRSTSKKRKQEEGGEKEAKSKQKYKKKSERPEWFNQKPAPGTIHETKKWNNIDWHYCCDETGGHCGGIWRRHDPKKCRPNTSKKYSKKKNEKKVTIKEAIADEELMGGYFSD